MFGQASLAGSNGCRSPSYPPRHIVPYLEPTEATAIALIAREIQGPIMMLNLLRFREIADYSGSPELAPADLISGAEAYRRYADSTMPHLLASGGEVVFEGSGGEHFIGPSHERWDHVLLVKQRSLEDFFSFASNPDYMAGIGHRTAAIEDSRLLPIVEN